MIKISLWLGGVILLAIVATVVAGYLLPSRHLVSRSASYRTTPERLYALIAGSQAWRPEVANCEVSTGANGDEILRETTRDGQTIVYEVTDRVPPVSLKRRIVSQDLPYRGTWTYRLNASDGTTTVTITEEGEVDNPIFRFMARFVFGHSHTIDGYLRALGKAAEQGEQVTR